MPEAPHREYVPEPAVASEGYCISARLAWFSPARMDLRQAWLFSVDRTYRSEAYPTAFVGICVLGLTLELELGWSRAVNGGQS